MNRQQLLQLGIVVLLILLPSVGCESSAPTPEAAVPAATPTQEQATATATLMSPTPLPPTSTPPPMPSADRVSGKLVGATSNRPIAEAVVVLCEQQSPLECIFHKEHVTNTSSDGSFSFADVSPGSYTPLYVIPGKEYELSVDDLAEGQTIPLRPPFEVSTDKGTISGASFKGLEMENGRPVRGAAAIPLIGLTIEYQDGPLTIVLEEGKQNIEIDVPVTEYGGEVSGTLVGATSKHPIADAEIILCNIEPWGVSEVACSFSESLTTVTDKEGTFRFVEVPSGVYTPLYISPGSEYEFSVDDLNHGDKIPFAPPFDIFTANIQATGAEFKGVELKDDKPVKGAAILPSIGLTVEYRDGPVTVSVDEDGQLITLDIDATDL